MLLSAALALAADGIDVTRARPAAAGAWLSVPDVRLPEPEGVGARWTSTWVDDPLAWRDEEGGKVPLLHAAFGGELTATAHHGPVGVAVGLPAWVVSGPQLAPAFGLGDARLTALVRVLAGPEAALGVVGELRLPTGDPDRWTGSGAAGGGGGVTGAITAGALDLAGVVTVDTLPEWELPGFRWGPRLTWALGVAHPLPRGLRVLAETDGAASLRAGGGPPPIEARLGLGFRPHPTVDLALAAGTGLTAGVGAPDARVVAQARYLPLPHRP